MMRWQRRWAVILIAAAILLAAAGIAIGVFSDGVVYTEPQTEIVTINDLTLVLQESNIGTCIEVRIDSGGMGGGCGTDFEAPLSVELGLINGTTYASGWTLPETAELVLTFPNGEEQTVTEFEEAEGYDVLFFLITPVPLTAGKLGLEATAFDASGTELESVTHNPPQP